MDVQQELIRAGRRPRRRKPSPWAALPARGWPRRRRRAREAAESRNGVCEGCVPPHSACPFDDSFELVLSKHLKSKNLLRYGVLAEPVREEVGQVADFFRRFAAGGPNKRKRVNGNREVRKNFP